MGVLIPRSDLSFSIVVIVSNYSLPEVGSHSSNLGDVKYTMKERVGALVRLPLKAGTLKAGRAARGLGSHLPRPIVYQSYGHRVRMRGTSLHT